MTTIRHGRILLLATLLSLGAASALKAQSSCTPVTPAARARLRRFLLSNDKPWLSVLGLTDASADTIRALTEPADALACARIRASLPLSPLYMFWARSRVVAITVSPAAPAGKFRNEEWKPYAWVFDTLGKIVFAQNTRWLATPQDLHVAASSGGRVTLGWTNPLIPMERYQVERAVDNGPFRWQSVWISGSLTTWVDSTAVPNATYRYRLLSHTTNPGGYRADDAYTNETSVSVTADLNTLARTSSGLLFRDRFDRPDEPLVGPTRSWDRVQASAGADADLNLVGGVAVFTGNADNLPEAKHAAESGALLVQTDWKRVSGGRTGIALLESQTGARVLFALRDPNHGWELWWKDGGAWNNVLNSGTAVTDSTRLTLLREDYRVRFWAGDSLVFDWNSSAARGVAMRGGMYMIQPTQWDDVVVCKGSIVTVAGLAKGYRARVSGALSELSAGNAMVSIDLAGKRLPATQLELVDQTGTVVKTLAPTGGVCGGDAYGISTM